MDSFNVSSNVLNTEMAARQRFESFKMGGGAPPQNLQIYSKHSHGRSRSRNNSVSSFTLPVSNSAPSLPPSRDVSPVPSNTLSKRPNSHHRRRSSVSTRCESAELMGVSLPELPTANSDDNIKFGDRDSIRRRALLALEGKPDLAFSKVEIPDFTSPDTTKQFELPTKASFPPGAGLSTHGISGLMGKRDSFKMFGSPSASKDQLGTLLEEEEEEEEVMQKQGSQQANTSIDEVKEIPRAFNGVPGRVSLRPRPATLNLRPLSLVQGSAVNVITSMPTPAATSSPRPHSQKASVDALSTNDNFAAGFPVRLVNLPSASRRFSYSCDDSTSSLFELDCKKRSSISYKHSSDSTPRDLAALPTPELTPIERRFSLASDQETLVDQPLSAAEQHFLFKSHHILLARIGELERTLRHHASRSRHVSYTSDVSVPSSEPSDEMLQLISDLKAERDELKRDVDGWRRRVADADRQASILAKRIETERREAWVARSQLETLEVEKSGLEKALEEKSSALAKSMTENAALACERDGLKDEITKLSARMKDADVAIDECARLRAALDQERARCEEFEKLLDDAGLLNTPKLSHSVKGPLKRSPFTVKPVSSRPCGLGFQSIDSESSTTDVESVDDSFIKGEFILDAVVEEDAETSDTENGLGGYEDEDDSDVSFSSPGGSSIGSGDELGRDTNILPTVEGVARALPCSQPTQPSHAPHASLSKTWTFPKGATTTLVKREEEVDRFFGCLDDADGSPILSEGMSKTAFSSAFGSVADDELPPFFIPSDVGVVVESSSIRNLGIVPEDAEEDRDADDEDELIGEAVEGGIRFVFNVPPLISVTPPLDASITPPEIHVTPPPESTAGAIYPLMDDVTIRKPVPSPEITRDFEESRFSSFTFPRTKAQPQRPEPMTPPSSSSPTSGGPSWKRNNSPPSSIPRATSLLSMASRSPPAVTFTPSKSLPGRSMAPSSNPGMIPLSKKGSSAMPQSVTTSKYTTPVKPRLSASSKGQPGVPNGSTFKPQFKFSMNAPALRKTTTTRRK